ncbi:MAG TPA: glycosyltransferase family 4 protein [Vicinamibacterales bacterium]|nr:glycosyltransferase family 4 protein [Vicinamibacterales bacterium]
MTPLKIAIVVHGRFHGFDLARELLARGHDVTVFTNYPSWAVTRFGIPAARARSFPIHGVLSRALMRLPGHGPIRHPEAWLHKMFGRWAERELSRERWDVIHCWSGVSQELLESPRVDSSCTMLMRGSAHITVQSRLLQEEEARTGVALDRPSDWMHERELREYGLADRILVLSTFSRQSFEDEGTPPERISTVPLGVQVDAFRPPPEVIEERTRRILTGEPLRVLFVGAVSYRKGFLDIASAIDKLNGRGFEFELVGPILPECAPRVEQLRGKATFAGKRPQAELPASYHASDLFLFPTIEDGFPAVMAQAKAAALPMLTTAHGAGLDIVTPGQDGWIVPVRDPAAIVDRLVWCAANRPAVASIVQRVYDTFRPRDWAQVAADFEAVCVEATRPVANREPAHV